MAPISKEEFEKMVDEGPRKQNESKVSNEDLLNFLSDKAATVKEIATFLASQQVSALSRLKRMQEKGLVVSKNDGKKLLFTKA